MQKRFLSSTFVLKNANLNPNETFEQQETSKWIE